MDIRPESIVPIKCEQCIEIPSNMKPLILVNGLWICQECHEDNQIDDTLLEISNRNHRKHINDSPYFPCRFCGIELNNATNWNFACLPCHLKHEINEVHPGVFVTDSYSSRQYEFLKQLGIKQILTIAEELSPHRHPDFKTMHIYIEDSTVVNIRQYFEQTHEFISKAPTLVHCFAGISRSASIAISYVMKTKKTDLYNAMAQCKSVRQRINPNTGFMAQLAEYEKELNIEVPRWKPNKMHIPHKNQATDCIFTFDEEIESSTDQKLDHKTDKGTNGQNTDVITNVPTDEELEFTSRELTDEELKELFEVPLDALLDDTMSTSNVPSNTNTSNVPSNTNTSNVPSNTNTSNVHSTASDPIDIPNVDL